VLTFLLDEGLARQKFEPRDRVQAPDTRRTGTCIPPGLGCR
jgi:hypothetical protein